MLQPSLPPEQCPVCKCYRLWHPSQRSCPVLVDVDTCALHRSAWLGTSPLLGALAASDSYSLASPFTEGPSVEAAATAVAVIAPFISKIWTLSASATPRARPMMRLFWHYAELRSLGTLWRSERSCFARAAMVVIRSFEFHGSVPSVTGAARLDLPGLVASQAGAVCRECVGCLRRRC